MINSIRRRTEVKYEHLKIFIENLFYIYFFWLNQILVIENIFDIKKKKKIFLLKGSMFKIKEGQMSTRKRCKTLQSAFF